MFVSLCITPLWYKLSMNTKRSLMCEFLNIFFDLIVIMTTVSQLISINSTDRINGSSSDLNLILKDIENDT